MGPMNSSKNNMNSEINFIFKWYPNGGEDNLVPRDR